MAQLSILEFARKIKDKYPVYEDVGDLDLTEKIVNKYPTYRPGILFPEDIPTAESPYLSNAVDNINTDITGLETDVSGFDIGMPLRPEEEQINEPINLDTFDFNPDPITSGGIYETGTLKTRPPIPDTPLAATAIGVLDAIPFIGPEGADVNKIRDEFPGSVTAGQISSNALLGLGGAVGAAKILGKTAVVKSPLLFKTLSRVIPALTIRGGQSVENVIKGKQDIQGALFDSVIESGGGAAFSIIPEIIMPPGVAQLLAQPLADLIYQASIDGVRGNDKVLSKEWFKEQIPNLAMSLGFASQDVADGKVFISDQKAMRSELTGIADKVRSKKEIGKKADIEPVVPLARLVEQEEAMPSLLPEPQKQLLKPTKNQSIEKVVDKVVPLDNITKEPIKKDVIDEQLTEKKTKTDFSRHTETEIRKARQDHEAQGEAETTRISSERQNLIDDLEDIDFASTLRSDLSKKIRGGEWGKLVGNVTRDSNNNLAKRSKETESILNKIADSWNLAKEEGRDATAGFVPPDKTLNSVDYWQHDDVQDLIQRGLTRRDFRSFKSKHNEAMNKIDTDEELLYESLVNDAESINSRERELFGDDDASFDFGANVKENTDLFDNTDFADSRSKSQKSFDDAIQEKGKNRKENQFNDSGLPMFSAEERVSRATKQEDLFKNTPVTGDAYGISEKIKGMKEEVSPLIQGGLAANKGIADLPDKAGNINLKRINADYPPKKAILEASAKYEKQIDEKRRGKITHEETRKLADDLGMSARKLLKRKKGEVWNAENALAARDLLNKSSHQVVKLQEELGKKLNDGTITDADRADFKLELQKHGAIQAEVSGLTAEAGRLLSSFRIMSENKGKIESAKELTKDKDFFSDEDIDRILATKPDQKGIIKATKMFLDSGRDGVFEYWINSILSAPITHVRNITSNALVGATRSVIERPAAAAIDAVIAPLTGRKRERYFREVGAEVYGASQGIMDGVKAFSDFWKTGIPSAGALKIEGSRKDVIPGLTGKIIRAPTKLLGAADEFFKSIAYRADIQSQAYRQARKEGSKDIANRIAELVSEPSKEMQDHASYEMKYRTFTQPLGNIGRAAQSLRSSHGAFKYILPFMNTPANIAKYTYERTPLNFINIAGKKINGDLKGAEFSDELAKTSIGSGLAAATVMLAQQGLVTGGAPTDKRERDELYRTGWQPYSFKVGKKYVSYGQLEPLGSIVGLAADFATMDLDKESDNVISNFASKLAMSFGNNFLSKSFMKGPKDFLNALFNLDQEGTKWLERFGESFVPNIVASGTRSLDPTIRQSDNFFESIKKKIPVLSEMLHPKRDIWGREVNRSATGWEGFISPVWFSDDTDNLVDKELDRLNANISSPSRTIMIRGEKRKLTSSEYDKYSKDAGEDAYKKVEAYINSSQYKNANDEIKIERIKALVNRSRRINRREIAGN